MFDTIAIRSPIERQRIQALTNICRRPGPKPVLTIIPMLKDTSQTVRVLACEALVESQDQGVVNALRSVATDDTFDVAQVALKVLSTLGDAGIRSLWDLIRMPGALGPKERGEYAKFSGKLLRKILEPQWDIPRRVAAIRVIASLPSSAALLVEMLSDSQIDAVNAAVDALIEFGPVTVPLCVAALTGPAWTRRHNAALILSRMNWQPTNDVEKGHFLVLQGKIDEALKLGASVSGALALALEDPNKRVNAALGLLRLQDSRGAEAFKRWLAQDQEKWIQGRSDTWLGVYGLVEQVSTDQSAELRGAIVRTLRETDSKSALEAICARFRGGTDLDIPVLVELLEGPYVRRDQAVATLLLIDSATATMQAALLKALSVFQSSAKENAKGEGLCRSLIGRLAQFPNAASTKALTEFLGKANCCLLESFGELSKLDEGRARQLVLSRLSAIKEKPDQYIIEQFKNFTFPGIAKGLLNLMVDPQLGMGIGPYAVMMARAGIYGVLVDHVTDDLVPLLIRLAQDPSTVDRGLVIGLLGYVHDAALVEPHLIQLLRTDLEDEAFRALVRLGSPIVVRSLLQKLETKYYYDDVEYAAKSLEGLLTRIPQRIDTADLQVLANLRGRTAVSGSVGQDDSFPKPENEEKVPLDFRGIKALASNELARRK